MPAAAQGDLRRWLPYWWVDADVVPERIWEIATPTRAELVISDMELWIAEHADGFVFVHAGVVAWEDRALLLPGRSHDGKTTLTAELLRAGATYGSDEYAVLDPAGFVHPYPRPLAIRGVDGRRRVSAADLGADTFAEGLPVAGIAALRYEPEATPVFKPLTPGMAVLRLFECTICARSRPEAALDVLLTLASGATVVEGERGDVDDALLTRLRDLVG